METRSREETWLPDLCAGKTLASFGLTEPNAGSDAGASKTTATLEGNQWVINGSKIFITNSTSEYERCLRGAGRNREARRR